jgi:TP901 family phage tail tape measure protein
MADTPIQIIGQVSLELSKASKQLREFVKSHSARLDVVNSNQAIAKLQKVGKEAKKATTFAEKFGDALALKTEQFAVYTVAAAAIGKVTFELARATRESIRFEQEMVRLSQVFNVSKGSVEGLSNSIRKLAIDLGVPANQLARTSVILAQTGLTAQETADALEALAKTSLTATFGNLEKTTDGAVAIMQQFNLEASELEDVFDKINAVTKKFAVESNDVIEAVKRAGSVFSATGGTFEEFLAVFTSIRSTSRETSETIATGLRTIVARVQRPKVIDYFKELGIELETVDGNFIGPRKAITAIADGLQRLGIVAGQTKFAEVVEQLGGLRQVARVIPLLQQTGKQQEALALQQNAAGSVAKDVAKAQETLAVRFDQTKQRFEELVFKITQTSSFQGLADLFLNIANTAITLGDALRDLLPLLVALQGLRVGTSLIAGTRRIFGAQGGGNLARPPFQLGGPGVLNFSSGSKVPGAGNRDSVLAALTPGEVVLNRRQQNRLGEIYGASPSRIFSALGVPGFTRGGTPGKVYDDVDDYFDDIGLGKRGMDEYQARNDKLTKEAISTEKDLVKEQRELKKTIKDNIKANRAVIEARRRAPDPLGGSTQRQATGAARGRRTQAANRALDAIIAGDPVVVNTGAVPRNAGQSVQTFGTPYASAFVSQRNVIGTRPVPANPDRLLNTAARLYPAQALDETALNRQLTSDAIRSNVLSNLTQSAVVRGVSCYLQQRLHFLPPQMV